MKSLLLKSVLLIIVYFLIISAAIVNSFEPAMASNSLQNLNAPMHDGYNSSYNNSSISFKSQSKISQAPTAISVGSGYYSSHPIGYGGEIGSQTSIKNERSSASMQQDINYAHGVNGQMNVMATDSSRSRGDSKFSGSSTTQMKIDENVTNGQIHFGVLQGSDNSGLATDADGTINRNTDPLVEAWKKPDLEIDEDYIGTYHINKNMTISTSYNQNQRNDSWLDFPSGGYFDTNLPGPISTDLDKIFNCKIANPSKVFGTGLK